MSISNDLSNGGSGVPTSRDGNRDAARAASADDPVTIARWAPPDARDPVAPRLRPGDEPFWREAIVVTCGRLVVGLPHDRVLRAIELWLDVHGYPRVGPRGAISFRTALRLNGTDSRLPEFVRVFELLTGERVADPRSRSVRWETLRLKHLSVGFVARTSRRAIWFEAVAFRTIAEPPISVTAGPSSGEPVAAGTAHVPDEQPPNEALANGSAR